MKTFLAAFIAITALLSSTVIATSADKLTLASKGQTDYVIALAGDASAPEKNAAEELRSYLGKVTGVAYSLVSADQINSRPVIAVGPGAAKKVLPSILLDRKELGDDGIVILTSGKNLILTGAAGSKRGTLYAVFEFLERQIGVRWWTSTEEYIPNLSTLTVSNLSIQYTPPLAYRDILYRDMIGGSGTQRGRFEIQMKLNGHFAGLSTEWGGNWNIVGFCHTAFVWMPPDTFFNDHPEWYSEIGGKRIWKNAQLCYTNEAMIAELTKNVLEQIRQNPDAGIIDISQNDWGNNCQCENCRKIDQAEGSPTGSMLYCINKVAESVEKVYPEYQIEFIAYQYSRKPPKHMKPRRNVIVRVCVIERSCTQPIDNKRNKALMNDLKMWKATAPNLLVWDYTDQLTCSLIPHPNVNVLPLDFRTYVKNNVKGVFCEGDDSSLPIGDDEMKHYIMAHALWNPNINTRQYINEFINGYYGAAAPMIRKYVFNQIARSSYARTTWRARTYIPRGADASYMSLNDMNLYTRLFNQAEQVVQNDPVILKRVKRMRLQVDNQWIAGYLRYKNDAKSFTTVYLGPKDMQSAIEKLVVDAKALGVDGLACLSSLNVDKYASDFRSFFTLYADAPFRAPLPAPFCNLPAKDVLDVQEDWFDLLNLEKGDASLVADPLASNKHAAFLNPANSSWSVQANHIERLNAEGLWHAYGVVRVDKIKDKGVAFDCGAYDWTNQTSECDICVQLDPSDQPVPVDTKTPARPVKAANIDVRDGKYHIIDFGVHEINTNKLSFWFGTTGGVSPENVKGIYIDRMFFVKVN